MPWTFKKSSLLARHLQISFHFGGKKKSNLQYICKREHWSYMYMKKKTSLMYK